MKFLLIKILFVWLLTQAFPIFGQTSYLNDSVLVDFGLGQQKVHRSYFNEPVKGLLPFSFLSIGYNTIQRTEIPFKKGKILKETPLRKETQFQNKEIEQMFYVKNDSFIIKYYNETNYFLDSNKLKNYSNDRIQMKIKNRWYKLDSLFYGKEFTKNYPLNSGSPLHKTCIISAFELMCNNKHYLLFYTSFESGNNSYSLIKPILFEISLYNNEAFFIPPPDDYQSSSSSYCFNDFDKDGNLDYLQYDFFSTENIKIYSIYKNIFTLRKDCELNIFKYGGYYGRCVIDLKKSKWFWELKKN